MKKYVLIILIIILFINTACGTIDQNRMEKPDGENSEGGDEISKEEDIEPDINYYELQEDKELTDSAIEEKIGEYDITLMDNEDIAKLIEATDIDKIKGVEIVETYNTKIPDNLSVSLLYNKYSMPFDYILITSDNAKIYKMPSLDSETLGQASKYAKVKLVGKVRSQDGNDDEWYILSWLDNGENVYGFITSDSGTPRRFRFDKMIESIERLANQMEDNKYGYISNYKDRNGSPPLVNGKGMDKYGIQAYQSAPAYPNLNDMSDFRYFPDGMIVFITSEQGDYFKVDNLEYEGEYWIPKRYISFEDNIDRLTKVIVVDTTNQNQGVFEKRDNKWSLVSYTLATTGVRAQSKFETPKGYFKVLEKKERFYYLDDQTREVAGYAPYGTRFTAGAYIHGVPVAYIKKNGENIDPGIQEYLYTIGTFPRSHKCVRNYTSHAKFVYNWADKNSTAVIVIK
jgi:lipoprotein-anchoring transpeptidase ErfK/SrfK